MRRISRYIAGVVEYGLFWIAKARGRKFDQSAGERIGYEIISQGKSASDQNTGFFRPSLTYSTVFESSAMFERGCVYTFLDYNMPKCVHMLTKPTCRKIGAQDRRKRLLIR